jgi:hypothetical protein
MLASIEAADVVLSEMEDIPASTFEDLASLMARNEGAPTTAGF